jgi:hypothetical protein
MITVTIETDSAWDALSLVERLPGERWHLVEPDEESCDVCVTVPEAPELLDDLLDSIKHWLRDRERA